MAGKKTFPKAQWTRGLSSAYQSNLMGHITSSNTNLNQISQYLNHSLLGRLEVLGPGAAAAAGRRWQAAELERCWRKEERAHTLATAQGWRSYRTGFGKLD